MFPKPRDCGKDITEQHKRLLLQGNESNGNGSNPHRPDKEAYC